MNKIFLQNEVNFYEKLQKRINSRFKSSNDDDLVPVEFLKKRAIGQNHQYIRYFASQLNLSLKIYEGRGLSIAIRIPNIEIRTLSLSSAYDIHWISFKFLELLCLHHGNVFNICIYKIFCCLWLIEIVI